jgi:hypothetical protein
MCFSATASFGASIMLAGIGTLSFKNAKTFPLKILAIIPIVFSLQQFSEGWVWLSLTKERFSEWKQLGMYFFLFFAEVAWPICISFAMMRLEKKANRRKLLLVLFYASVFLSLVLAFSLFYYSVDARVMGNHIMYTIDTPDYFKSITNLIYFSTAVLPPLLSTVNKAKWIGVILIISYLVAKIGYPDYIISIWCYFATIITAIILWIILKSKKDTQILYK